MYGLVGAHRVGKTTLAKAYAEKAKIGFLQTNVGAIFAKLGLDPAANYSFGERLTIQEKILKEVDMVYGKHVGLELITDRTPIDMLAYTLAEAHPSVMGEEEELRLALYFRECIEVTNRRFSTVVLVQPGIPLKPEEGKAVASPGYIEHLNSIMLGLIVDERVKTHHFYIPRRLLEIQERIDALNYAFGRAKHVMQQDRLGESLH